MATTWSVTDKQQNTLSAGNLTATATSGGFSSGRTNVSWSAGKIYLEMKLGGGISNNELVGIANSSWNLFAQLGQSTPSNSVGVAVGNFDEVYVNNTFFSGGHNPCPIGDTVSMAVDYGVGRYWYSTDQMQTDIGAGAWNNSLTDNPATGTGGLDFSDQTGPFFGAWYSDTVGNSVTLNAHAPWHRAIPSGFTPADGNATTGALSASQGAQTMVATGSVGISGVLIRSQAAQTMVATGTTSFPARTGVLSASQGAQTMAAAGSVTSGAVVFGPLVASQGAQTMAASGTVTTMARIGVLSATQAAQTMAGFGFVGSVSIPIIVWMD